MEPADISQYFRHRAGQALIGPPEQAVSGLAFIGLRENGRKLDAIWSTGGSVWSHLDAALAEYPNADFLEVCLTQSVQKITARQWEKKLTNRSSGRYGIQIILPDKVYRLSPTEMIAQNRTPQRLFAAVLEKHNLSAERFFATGGTVELLGMKQFFCFPAQARAVAVYRGNTIVADSRDRDVIEQTIEGMGNWFMANSGSDGEIPYKYWPSRGEYSTADNTIRRFMATIALNRLGQAAGDGKKIKAARRNLQFNLARFYQEDKEFGLIAWDGSVKLGAVALAALAILESPQSEKFAGQYGKLSRTIEALWQDDGSFRTFYRPAERNDNQNFYPGEALLFLASALERDNVPEKLQRVLKSVDYYRTWFRSNRNPAFVPWHTMACAKLWPLCRQADLVDYVFEMNDWLLDHQQWGGDLDPDLWGRFYTPGKPYGPPHASSTGVFLESLVDALALAREREDGQRADRYETAIWRGIRSIAQLQFKDEIDTFYISRKARVIGSVRTEAYDNEVRVDNVQHALMALLRFRDLL